MHSIGYSRELDRRTSRIIFRLPSQELRRQLEVAARAHRATISGYVRSLVLEALRRDQEQKESEETGVFFG